MKIHLPLLSDRIEPFFRCRFATLYGQTQCCSLCSSGPRYCSPPTSWVLPLLARMLTTARAKAATFTKCRFKCETPIQVNSATLSNWISACHLCFFLFSSGRKLAFCYTSSFYIHSFQVFRVELWKKTGLLFHYWHPERTIPSILRRVVVVFHVFIPLLDI